MPWPNDSCAQCDDDLPDTGYRFRAVPRLGGARKRVCESCADVIDQQETLWGAEVDRAVRQQRTAAKSEYDFGALAQELLDRTSGRDAA